MLLEIRKVIVEEAISMNPVFDYEGLDEEVAQALFGPCTTASGTGAPHTLCELAS
jgi:hypothetical protein